MAIPITCPGCNAAFDVPENLVGKTIRCTTCKAQVSVVAPLVDAVEPAKKEFGWAAKSDLTPTTDEEPILASLRSDTVAPAKTVPASAKPVRASKPAVKSDVEVDEDEDEDDEPETKPSPAKKAKIPAVTPALKGGNAKKRQNDDDDDEDDQPKRKKKKKDESDGSGAKIAMIAGGVVALVAIVGLSIYLLTGEKKKDVAKTDTPAAEKAPVVAPQTSTPPNVPVANWQPITASGLAFEMPGAPQQRNESIPGGGTVKLYLLESPSKDFAYFASAIPLPANAPAAFSIQVLNEAADGFERGMTGGGIGGGGFGRNSQIRVSSKIDIQQDGFPGKEMQLTGKNGNEPVGGVVRLVLAGKQMYMFGVGADNYAAIRPQAQRFMSSVKITKTSDDMGTVAVGQPPKGPFPGPGPGPGPNPGPGPGPNPGVDPVKPPMPGPGPGGDPVPPIGVGQPPVGGETVGKLAAQLNGTFFAGGFDTEKRELVVVGLRTVGGVRQAGTIQRYSYPDFKLLGTVNIPSVATRAQLDSAKGLLYVTTVGGGINPAALSFSQFDRAAFIGDVAVYDLAQVRSAKSDDKMDLKPVATIQVGFLKNLVRDIVLSRDGASLFVLTAPQVGKGKSQVLQVNTADRKTVKTVDLPNTGWEMVSSPDGQKLFISSMGLNAIVPPLMILETSTMTLAPSFAPPKAVFNLAVSKDGRIVTSSLNVNVGGLGLGNPGMGPIGPGGPFGPGPGGPPMGGVGGIAVNPGDISVMDANGNKVDALSPGTTGVSNNGYVEVTPDGKYLICSSHHPQLLGSGLDVYETSDKLIGDKKVASMKKAGEAQLGGTFLVSPDSEYIVFHNGAVLKLDDLGAGVGGNGPPGVGGFPQPPPGGVGMPPMGFPPKGFPPKGPGPGGDRPPPKGPPGPGGLGMPPGVKPVPPVGK